MWSPLWWPLRRRWERRIARRQSDLTRFERREYSQNGEDGILDEILRRLSVDTGTAVEIGASDGEENITRALVERRWPAI